MAGQTEASSREGTAAGFAAALLAALCWGAATVMSKAALDGVAPVLLFVLQLLPCVAVLWLYIFVRGLPPGRWASIRRFAWLGILEPGLAFMIGLIGLTGLKAGAATLIQSSEAIMIVIVSTILHGTRPTWSFVALSLIAFAGILLALGIARPGDMEGNTVFGVALLTVATAVAALYVVLSSRIAAGAPPVVIVAWNQTVSLILALAALPLEVWLTGTPIMLPSTPQLWAVVLMSGIVQYAMAFSLYMFALSRISVNAAGSFLNLIPVFGLLGAYVFLAERLSPLQIAGAIITIVSVLLIQRSAGGHETE